MSIDSNSTVIGPFNWSEEGYEIYFNVSGGDGTVGYLNITIPKSFLKIDFDIPFPPPYWQIFIDETIWMNVTTWLENATHSFVYFTYPHSEHLIEVKGNWIVPEFTQFLLPITLLAITILILLISKILGGSRGTSPVSLRKAS